MQIQEQINKHWNMARFSRVDGGFFVGSLDLQGTADQLIHFNSSSTGEWPGIIMEESCKTGQINISPFIIGQP